MQQRDIIQLTKVNQYGSNEIKVLIGVKHIITVETGNYKFYFEGCNETGTYCTKITLREAMVKTVYVYETDSQIYNLINNF